MLDLLVGLLVLAAVLPAAASAAECTDTWTGPAEGEWATAKSWSTGKVPTETDVACIGSGKTVKVGIETRKVAIVQGEGALTVFGGSLELTRSPGEGVPTLGALTLSGTGILTGVGELDISTTLTGSSGSMHGTGRTVLLSEASGSISSISLTERTLVNKGGLSIASGHLSMTKTSKLENSGTLTVNVQGAETGITHPTFEPGALLVNTGTVRKTSGSGTSMIQADFENSGTIKAETGTLEFLESSKGTLLAGSVLEGSVKFQGPAVTGQSFTASGGTMTVGALGSLSIESGYTANVANFTAKGPLSGAGEIDVSNNLTWESAKMSGTGKTVLAASGSGTVSGATLEGRTFVNKGTMTLGSSYLVMSKGATLENIGTFNANTEGEEHAILRLSPTPEPHVVNSGTFQKISGTGETEIQPLFENSGELKPTSGKLKIVRPVNKSSGTHLKHQSSCGDPVECSSGNFSETQTDFAIGGRGVGLDLSRTYSAQAAAVAGAPGAFGYGWTSSFGDRLTSEEEGKKLTLTQADGGTVTFAHSGEAFTPPITSQDILSGSSEAGYTLTVPAQTKYKFSGAGKLESVTDPNGNATTLAYNKSGQLETITDPVGRKITLTYNGEGLVESAKDPMGHVVKYTYESKNLKAVTLPGEASANWQFKYDGSHRMTSMTDGRGGKTTNEYDGSSRVKSQTDPAERTLIFEYAPFHTKITNKATEAVTDEWFTSNNQPYSVTHGFGTAAATTETFTYNGEGLLLSKTDGNGHKTTYAYDEHGNKTSETDPAEDETKWTYNEAHEVLSETTPEGEKTTITRDGHGNPETISRPAPKEKTQTTTLKFGAHGELESITNPVEHTWSFEYDSKGDVKAEIDPEGDKQTWAYNEDSRVTSSVNPRGNEEGAEAAKYTTTIERDALGRPTEVIGPLEHVSKYAYDADGNLETVTDPKGHKTKYTYNADNEPTKVERPNSNVEETSYDGAGQVISQTDGNKHTTTYARNVLEQPAEVIDPLERKTTSTFDLAGNLKTKKDPDGRTTTYGYDNADQLKEISYSDGITPKGTFGYDKNGNLTIMSDGTGESSYEYDQLDRLIHSKDGNGDTASWEYNLGDEPIGLTYPNGKSISRLYDKAGRLESVTDWLGHTTSFAYNKNSELKTTTFPSGTGNVDEYAFDRTDRMSAVTMKKGAETLASLTYARDKASQLESLTSKGLPGAEEESFAYDENERLKTAGAGSYEYDNANNLTKAPGTTNAFDKASQLESVTGATFSYDKEGERTKRTLSSGPATTYKYDQAGNLTAVERLEEGETPAIAESFSYDGTGLMASRTVGLSTQHLIWDSSEGLSLLLSDGENSYVYGPGGIAIEQISSGEAPTYLHQDQLGSTRLLTNSSGEVAGSTTFAPYGAVAGKTGAASSPLGFAGQYTLSQSGLVYLRARFYDPATAQFMSVDPLIPVTRAPYFYAGGNPLRYVDRSGLEAELEVPCTWPFCGPPPPAVEPLEEAANSFNDFANSLFGDPEEISETVTVNPSVVAARSREGEEESQEDCEGRELVRKGEELLGRGHSRAGREKFNEWWRGLGRRNKGLYNDRRGPKPRKGG